MLNRLKFHQIIHDTTTSMHQQIACTRKNDILGSWRLIACCKLAPSLARKMWRHTDVIGRNEYLNSTLLESTIPYVYSLQFLFTSTYYYQRYERKCEWVFIFWTQCMWKCVYNERKIKDFIDKTTFSVKLRASHARDFTPNVWFFLAWVSFSNIKNKLLTATTNISSGFRLFSTKICPSVSHNLYKPLTRERKIV